MLYAELLFEHLRSCSSSTHSWNLTDTNRIFLALLDVLTLGSGLDDLQWPSAPLLQVHPGSFIIACAESSAGVREARISDPGCGKKKQRQTLLIATNLDGWRR